MLIRGIKVHCGEKGGAGVPFQNRVWLVPPQCSQPAREALEKLSEFRLEQALLVADRDARPVRENACGSPAHHVVLKRTLITSSPRWFLATSAVSGSQMCWELGITLIAGVIAKS